MPRTSRLYAGAAYFRGLIAARLGHFDKARNAFCEILPGKNQGTSNAVTDAVSGMVSGETLAFTIDGRYFQLQDLARLALGRIAHERDRYDEAYYFYFSVPEDSDRLAEALFEAAWSMYQKGEVRAARAFVDSFDRSLPRFAPAARGGAAAGEHRPAFLRLRRCPGRGGGAGVDLRAAAEAGGRGRGRSGAGPRADRAGC